jgi:CheY-like chemotaxis protein
MRSSLGFQPPRASCLTACVTCGNPEGWGQESDKEKAYAAGFDQHLRKPVDPATVLEALAKL